MYNPCRSPPSGRRRVELRRRVGFCGGGSGSGRRLRTGRAVRGRLSSLCGGTSVLALYVGAGSALKKGWETARIAVGAAALACGVVDVKPGSSKLLEFGCVVGGVSAIFGSLAPFDPLFGALIGWLAMPLCMGDPPDAHFRSIAKPPAVRVKLRSRGPRALRPAQSAALTGGPERPLLRDRAVYMHQPGLRRGGSAQRTVGAASASLRGRLRRPAGRSLSAAEAGLQRRLVRAMSSAGVPKRTISRRAVVSLLLRPPRADQEPVRKSTPVGRGALLGTIAERLPALPASQYDALAGGRTIGMLRSAAREFKRIAARQRALGHGR